MLLRVCRRLILAPWSLMGKAWDSLSTVWAGVLLTGVWLGGLAVVWAMHPPGPFVRWAPPAVDVVQGFLDGGLTAVTARRAKDRVDYTTGPLQMWDVRSGRLVASHFSKDDEFHSVEVSPRGDWLMIVQRDPGRWLLRLCDAKTGQDVGQFESRLPHAGLAWTLSPDQGLTAFATMEADEPLVEWREAPGGKLVARLPGCKAPMFFSPDGRRFAASLGRTFAVFEAPSGRMILNPPEKEPPAGAYPVTPRQFSPKGSLLLDSDASLWDLASGLPPPLPAASLQSGAHFPPGGRQVFGLAKDSTGCRLVCHDLVDGREDEPRRREIPIQHPVKSYSLAHLRPTEDLLVVVGVSRDRAHLRRSSWDDFGVWLSKALTISPAPPDLGPAPRVAEFLVINDATAEILAQGNEIPRYYWGDSRILIASEAQRPDQHSLWNIPAQRPWQRIVMWVGMWSVVMLAVWHLARRRARVGSARRLPNSDNLPIRV